MQFCTLNYARQSTSHDILSFTCDLIGPHCPCTICLKQLLFLKAFQKGSAGCDQLSTMQGMYTYRLGVAAAPGSFSRRYK